MYDNNMHGERIKILTIHVHVVPREEFLVFSPMWPHMSSKSMVLLKQRNTFALP